MALRLVFIDARSTGGSWIEPIHVHPRRIEINGLTIGPLNAQRPTHPSRQPCTSELAGDSPGSDPAIGTGVEPPFVGAHEFIRPFDNLCSGLVDNSNKHS